jgi:hypothetical protein
MVHVLLAQLGSTQSPLVALHALPVGHGWQEHAVTHTPSSHT